MVGLGKKKEKRNQKKLSLSEDKGLVVSDLCLADHVVTRSHEMGLQWSSAHFPQQLIS